MVLKILRNYQGVEILLSFVQDLFINLIYANKVCITNRYMPVDKICILIYI